MARKANVTVLQESFGGLGMRWHFCCVAALFRCVVDFPLRCVSWKNGTFICFFVFLFVCLF